MTISGPRGGSGKSVTALNLSVSMGLYKKKVLLVDCDPLGCVSDLSGVRSLDCPFDLVSVLSGRSGLVESISETEFNCLDILPGGAGLFPLSLKLSRRAANEKLLRLLIKEVRGDYDFVVLDCPSSFGYLSVAAMTAADWLVAPLPPYANATEDFHALLKSVRYVRQTHDTDLEIAGILLNRCSGAQGTLDEGEKPGDMADLIYDHHIPEDPAVAESVRRRTPLALYDINAPAARAYLGLAREMILAFNP